MVWGAFCGTTKSDLIYIPGKAKISSATYVNTVLEPALIPIWHQCCEKYGWTIVQVNAPGHKGLSNRCKELNEVDILQWPAQPADLNCIESVWRELETELVGYLGTSIRH